MKNERKLHGIIDDFIIYEGNIVKMWYNQNGERAQRLYGQVCSGFSNYNHKALPTGRILCNGRGGMG